MVIFGMGFLSLDFNGSTKQVVEIKILMKLKNKSTLMEHIIKKAFTT